MKFLNFLRNKLGICNHEWEDVDKTELTVYGEDHYGNLTTLPRVYRIIILQRCKKCGKYRTYKYYL